MNSGTERKTEWRGNHYSRIKVSWKLFMRKSGLPVLKKFVFQITEQPYWIPYQQITYNPITTADLQNIKGLTYEQSALTVVENQ
jgi:hypothetical protein